MKIDKSRLRERSGSIGKIIKNSRVTLASPENNSRIPLGTILLTNRQQQQNAFKRRQLESVYNDMMTKYKTKQKQIERQIHSIKKGNKNQQNKQNRDRGVKKDGTMRTLLLLTDVPLNTTKIQTKGDLLSKLAKQIELETELRNWKNRITKKNEGEFIQTAKKKFRMNENQLKLEFEEFDPFIQNLPAEGVQKIIMSIQFAITRCEDHWKKNIERKFCKIIVKEFFEGLDFEKKGFITLKVMTRELGLMMNKSLRNRDLYRIYKRMGNEQITFTSICKRLSYE